MGRDARHLAPADAHRALVPLGSTPGPGSAGDPVQQRRVQLGDAERRPRMPGRHCQGGAQRAGVEMDRSAAGEPPPYAHAAGSAGGGVDLPVDPLKAADHHRRPRPPKEQRRLAAGSRDRLVQRQRVGRRDVPRPDRAVTRSVRGHPARCSRTAADGGAEPGSSTSAGSARSSAATRGQHRLVAELRDLVGWRRCRVGRPAARPPRLATGRSRPAPAPRGGRPRGAIVAHRPASGSSNGAASATSTRPPARRPAGRGAPGSSAGRTRPAPRLVGVLAVGAGVDAGAPPARPARRHAARARPAAPGRPTAAPARGPLGSILERRRAADPAISGSRRRSRLPVELRLEADAWSRARSRPARRPAQQPFQLPSFMPQLTRRGRGRLERQRERRHGSGGTGWNPGAQQQAAGHRGREQAKATARRGSRRRRPNPPRRRTQPAAARRRRATPAPDQQLPASRAREQLERTRSGLTVRAGRAPGRARRRSVTRRAPATSTRSAP